MSAELWGLPVVVDPDMDLSEHPQGWYLAADESAIVRTPRREHTAEARSVPARTSPAGDVAAGAWWWLAAAAGFALAAVLCSSPVAVAASAMAAMLSLIEAAMVPYPDRPQTGCRCQQCQQARQELDRLYRRG